MPQSTLKRNVRGGALAPLASWLAPLLVLLHACSLDASSDRAPVAVAGAESALSTSKPESRVVLCHVTDDGGRHTIIVAAAAVSAHLGHGDAVGECRSGCVSAMECDDSNACTADACDFAGGCTHTAVECDDGNPCTADGCDPAIGCTTALNNGVSCDDGNDCTASDVCAAGACAGSAIAGCCRLSADCADDDDCTDDLCVDGACVNRGLECVPDNRCLAAFCDPMTGACDMAPVTCDDGNICTSDHCLVFADGSCRHDRVSCDDHDNCTQDSCDPEVGCVHTPVDGCTVSNPCLPDCGAGQWCLSCFGQLMCLPEGVSC